MSNQAQPIAWIEELVNSLRMLALTMVAMACGALLESLGCVADADCAPRPAVTAMLGAAPRQN